MTVSSEPSSAPAAAGMPGGDVPAGRAPRAPGRGEGRAARAAYVLAVAGLSLLLLVLVACAFSPRFVLWSGLWVPEAWPYPEVNRAVPTLEQTRRPLTEIPEVVATIRWRLLMPLVAYATGMPDWLFLALPHIGCLLVLAFVVHVAHRATGSWPRAAAAAAVVGASPWLFTSLGWLAYFDSWLVLGVLVAAFVRSRFALLAVYVLTPWVDERVILAAPLCLLVRATYLYRGDPRPLRRVLVDAVVVAAPVLPYAAARLLLIRGQDAGSARYVSDTFEMMRAVPPSRYLAGMWFAHRAAWFFIAAFVVVVWATLRGWPAVAAAADAATETPAPRGKPVAGVIVAAVVAATTALSLVIAGDLTRSPAVLMPACLAGMLLLWEWRRRVGDIAAAAVVLLAFVLPAQHVVSLFVVPIHSLAHELRAWRNPPDEVNARAHLEVAAAAARQGRAAEALHFVHNALKLDGSVWTSPEASLRPEELAAAGRIVDAVLAAAPAAPPAPPAVDGLFLRGLIAERQGNRAAAVADLRRALDAAPADWPHRAAAERALARLRDEPAAPGR